jgi:hypothetical protein
MDPVSGAFLTLFFCSPDPEPIFGFVVVGIRDGKKIRIRDKNPGSATLERENYLKFVTFSQ